MVVPPHRRRHRRSPHWFLLLGGRKERIVGSLAALLVAVLLLTQQPPSSTWRGRQTLLLELNNNAQQMANAITATTNNNSSRNNTKQSLTNDSHSITRLLESEYFMRNVTTTGIHRVWKNPSPLAASRLPPTSTVYGGPMISCSSHDTENHSPTTEDSAMDAQNAMTIIFTFSARYCHPDLRLFAQVWDSHVQHMPLFLEMPKQFVFDGFGDAATSSANSGGHRDQRDSAATANQHNISLSLERYQDFQQRLEVFVRNATRASDNLPSLRFYQSPINVGPVTLLQTILPTIATPLVYVGQDDFALNVTLDTQGVVATMLNAAMGYNHVRYLLLAKDYPKSRLPKTFFGHPRGSAPAADAPLKAVELDLVFPNHHTATSNPPHLKWKASSICLPPSARKVGFFSDNNHFALTELYAKYLLPISHSRGSVFMEQAHQRMALSQPQLWGQYYGSHQYTVDEQVLVHLDGRDLKWCR